MFRWVKRLFVEEVTELVEEKIVEETVLPEPEKEEKPVEKTAMELKLEAIEVMMSKMSNKLQQIYDEYEEFQQKLLMEVFIDICKEKYKDALTPGIVNRTWAELEPDAHNLFKKHRAANPERAIKDVCIDICEEKFQEVLARLEVSAKKIVVEDVTKRMQDVISNMSGHKNITLFTEKVLDAINALEADLNVEIVTQEVAATQDKPKDELVTAIDSFVTAFNSKPPILASEEEGAEVLPIEEETEPEAYLTVDERRFIELNELHPEYSPIAIFSIIHREKASQKQ